MAPRYHWSDSQGHRTLTQIVKKEIPEWKDGLYAAQKDIIIRVLDGEDVFCCMATGGGKSAMFAVPIIVLREMARNPHLYPDLPVLELKKLRVPAYAYCQETVTEARKAGRNLVREIEECKTWSVICVDPEHLRDKAWREISASDTFRANLVYGCTDEAHLINEWGAEFRPQFRHIGAFFRGRLPSSISVIALSATVQPGVPFRSICSSLGMTGSDFHVLRTSNERPNTQFIMEPLENGLGGTEFPGILPYLNSGRKAVIHCRTIDTLFRVFVYLWNSQPPGLNRLRRVQMYHSLRSFEDNEEILRLLEEDPLCQVVIATIAFSNGLNVKALLDSPIAAPVPTPSKSKNGTKASRPRKTKPMEHAKALVLVEQECYIAALNRIYENPPHKVTLLDCITAKRRLPCSLCAARDETVLKFPAPPLPPGITLPPFTPPIQPITETQKKLKLTKKEREEAELALTEFGETVRRAECKHSVNQNRPKSSFFPASIISSITLSLLALDSLAALDTLIQLWSFAAGHIDSLYTVIQQLQASIAAQREEARLEKNSKQRATRAAKRPAAKKTTRKKISRDFDSEEEEEEWDAPSSADDEADDDDERDEHPRSSPIPPPPKRSKPALREVTNQRHPPARRRGSRVQRQWRNHIDRSIEHLGGVGRRSN
ncbi:hypothetical protein DFH09DRAFT_1305775 [Mycena vulgaris]|nr:hypothetical protein DFH09DRAFT_1305775 [Mycena vulgaris]